MTTKRSRTPPRLFLGIEGGGTRTVALLADTGGRLVRRVELGPGNLRLLSDRQLESLFRETRTALPPPCAVGIGLAGTRTDADRERIRRMAERVWPGIPCYATDDLETALMAESAPKAFDANRRAPRPRRRSGKPARVLVLSGTGSCCFGRTTRGRSAKIGGWGHVLGDKGSGFEIGLRALKAVVYYLDSDSHWPSLGARLLRTLQLNEPSDLIDWVQKAGKHDIAALAVEVFDAWHDGDKIAGDILAGAAETLANDAISCAKRLAGSRAPVQFVLAGGVLINQPRFGAKVARLIRARWPAATITPLHRESAWGAVELAKRCFSGSERVGRPVVTTQRDDPPQKLPKDGKEVQLPSLASLKWSPTEQRNPRSRNLDKLSVADAVVLMLSEDQRIPPAILSERKKVERAVAWIAGAFRHGGRLFYVGAGSSGRLGVLDASECPPTFRSPRDQVQGIIAGGQRALWEAVEGAEDDPQAGARAIQFRGAGRRDVVVGIAASGRTPFVWGALGEARRRGARTVLLCFNPNLEVPRRNRPHLMIAPDLGPEILTGSTRLKAGTATKLILNIFTTLAMARTGKVISNLMVDLNPTNTKLRNRAVRIVRELSGADEGTARASLEKSGWVVKEAWRKQARKS